MLQYHHWLVSTGASKEIHDFMGSGCNLGLAVAYRDAVGTVELATNIDEQKARAITEQGIRREGNCPSSEKRQERFVPMAPGSGNTTQSPCYVRGLCFLWATPYLLPFF